MRNVFEISAAILASLGGGSVIIFCMSSWLGKVWANRILENEKKDHQLEIENYKSQLEIELQKINVINDKKLYISKIQYDKEFQIYQDIWEKLNECIVFTLQLYPALEDVPTVEEERRKWINKKYNSFVEKYNSYVRSINKYAPFYKEEFYDEFILVRNDCHSIGMIFKTYNYDVEYNLSYAGTRDLTMTKEQRSDVYNRIPKVLKERQKRLRVEIHAYLKNLQTL